MGAMPDPSAQRREPVEASTALNLCLLLGRILFNFGATTQRIQDSTALLARHLGYKADMLVSYDSLLITVSDGATSLTSIDSSHRFPALDLLGLVRVSHLLQGLARSQRTPEELEHALCAIRDAPPSHSVPSQVLAAGCAGAAFCTVNGGDPLSWICSFIAAAFIFAIRRPIAVRNFNFHLAVFTIAFAGSLLAGMLALITQTTTPAIALVAPVLFLVSGVPMINGGIDIVRNHVTIGIARVGFTQAVLFALCLGVGLTLRVLPFDMGPPYSPPGSWEILLTSIAGALGAGALAWLGNGGIQLAALCALGGSTGRLVRALVSLGGLDVITASLIGAVCSTLVVSALAERRRWPGVVAAVMAVLPMVPGYFAIHGVRLLLSFAVSRRGVLPGSRTSRRWRHEPLLAKTSSRGQ